VKFPVVYVRLQGLYGGLDFLFEIFAGGSHVKGFLAPPASGLVDIFEPQKPPNKINLEKQGLD